MSHRRALTRVGALVLSGAIGVGATCPALASPSKGHSSTTASSPNARYSSTTVTHTPAAAAPTGPLPPTVAVVNGKKYTKAQLDTQLETFQRGTLAKQVLVQMILKDLVHQRAVALHLTATPAEMQQAQQEAEMAAGGKLDQVLAQQGMTRAQFQTEFLEPKIELRNLSQVGVTVTPADVQTYFDQYRSQWAQPETLKLYRLHTATLDEANAAEAALKAGTSWNDAVTKYSNDPDYYKGQHGLYGAVLPETLPKELQDALTPLKAGEVTQPLVIKEEGTNPGYTIWRLGEVIPAKQPVLSEHTAEIRARLLQQKSKPEVDVLRDLVKNARIVDVAPELRDMFLPLLEPPQPSPFTPRPGGPGAPPGVPPGTPGTPPVPPPPPLNAPAGH